MPDLMLLIAQFTSAGDFGSMRCTITPTKGWQSGSLS